MHPTLNPTSELAKKLQKKDLKGNIIIAVVAVLILCVAIFTAYRKHYNQSFYMLNTDGVTYTYKAPKTNKKNVEIPTAFKGKTINTLGPWAYGDSPNLEKVSIPDSITTIGKNSFRNCSSLTSISIPSSVTTIGEGAFYKSGYYNDPSNWDGNELYLDGWLIAVKESDTPITIEINEGTKGIADMLFAQRSDIISVIIPDSVIYLGHSTFRENATIERVVIGSGLTTIEPYSFYSCYNLKSIELGENVSKIGSCAFSDCLNLVRLDPITDGIWYYTQNPSYTKGSYFSGADDTEEFLNKIRDNYSSFYWYCV